MRVTYNDCTIGAFHYFPGFRECTRNALCYFSWFRVLSASRLLISFLTMLSMISQKRKYMQKMTAQPGTE